MNVLLIQGHPHGQAFNRGLADAYAEGARGAGAQVEVLDLEAMAFDPVLHHGYAEIQPLEPDLQAAQRSIEHADHVVVAFPVWWGAPPALLKGFFDRTFLPGFAFEFPEGWPLPRRLLSGRSAHVILTMDAPQPVYAWTYRNSAHRAVIQGTLKFSGMGPVTSSTVSAVKYLPRWARDAQLWRHRQLGAWHVRRRQRAFGLLDRAA